MDENGRYVDDQGNFVDKFGNRVDKDGEYVVEAQPFLDDDGKPVIIDEDKKDEPTPQPTLPAPSTETVAQAAESADVVSEIQSAVIETVSGS